MPDEPSASKDSRSTAEKSTATRERIARAKHVATSVLHSAFNLSFRVGKLADDLDRLWEDSTKSDVEIERAPL